MPNGFDLAESGLTSNLIHACSSSASGLGVVGGDGGCGADATCRSATGGVALIVAGGILISAKGMRSGAGAGAGRSIDCLIVSTGVIDLSLVVGLAAMGVAGFSLAAGLVATGAVGFSLDCFTRVAGAVVLTVVDDGMVAGVGETDLGGADLFVPFRLGSWTALAIAASRSIGAN